VASLCDDGDPCTEDQCAGATCAHIDRHGTHGVACAFEGAALGTPLCPGERIPRVLLRRLDAAHTAAERAAEAVKLGDARRFVRRTAARLREARRTIGRVSSRKLSDTCASALEVAVDGALRRADDWLALPTL